MRNIRVKVIQTNPDYTDIEVDHWTLRALPAGWRPYGRLMRLDRPIGWWLLLLPCWWSLALAWKTQAHSVSALGLAWYFILFLIGAIVMRGAGCVINDLWDRDFDAKVERTRSRPIPSGEVSPKQALGFTGGLSLIGLLVLLSFNWSAVVWGLGSIALIIIYPLAKRVTYWPQFVLGLAFNWGALLGWVVITGTMAWPAVALYLAGIFWTLGYDTIYAHQDKEDDLIVGVKSTALKFGDKTKIWLCGFVFAQTFLLLFCGFIAGASMLFWIFALAALGLFLHQLAKVDIDSPEDCIAMFKAQLWVGLVVLIGCFLA